MSATPVPEVAAVAAAATAPATQSPTIGKLAEALAKAQGVFEAASKDRNNPYFNSRYATLSSVWDACREGLSANGLAVVQQVGRAGANEVSVRTMLAHSSGEWVSSVITLPVLPMQKKDGTETKVTAQSYGSAITYGRRYGLAAAVGIAPDDDDDGNAASHGEPTSRIQAPSTQAPVSAPVSLPPGRVLTGVKVPATFKNDGGKDLAELDDNALSRLADYFLEASQKPEKARYAAQNKALHDACVLEGMKRQV